MVQRRAKIGLEVEMVIWLGFFISLGQLVHGVCC